MLFALNENNVKIAATPKARGKCPSCGETVIACVGEIIYPYWRHEQKSPSNCVAAQYENEGEWHATWKFLFGKEFAEQYIRQGDKTRRADVRLNNGLVIEIQHSSIDTREIRARERFHHKMIWVFDASGPVAAGRLRYEQGYFHWIKPRISIRNCQVPVFLDVGFGFTFEIHELEINKFLKEDWHTYRTTVFKGTGKLMTRDEFKGKMFFADEALKNASPVSDFKKQYFNIGPSIQLDLF